MSKLLVVEDDQETALLVQRGLEEAGYVVSIAGDGALGLERARAESFDLIILDILMPKRDGWSVLCELRKADPRTPVLILSAQDAIEYRVRGLEQGADDYLIKPFSFDELAARVGAICRRAIALSAEALNYQDLRLDEQRECVFRGNLEIPLSTKEYQLIRLLVRRRGEVLPKAYITECVWDIRGDAESNVLEVSIRRLRQKVDEPFARKYIHTVRGQGYVLR